MRRRRFLRLAAAAVGAAALAPQALAWKPWAAAPAHHFTAGDESFLLDGHPFVVRSGSMHYARVPRPYWRDRMRKLRALGLNTLCTYVFWNLHEPEPGHFDFSGQNDLDAYLQTAQEEGLFVILRPGPYVCTEWDFGGFPAWLLRPPGMRVRTADPKFLAAADRYLQHVGAQVAHRECARGGPILMVQVENEYGSFIEARAPGFAARAPRPPEGSDGALAHRRLAESPGDNDHHYLGAIRDGIRRAGFRGLLYTSNGPGAKMLAQGSLPGLTSVINFGDGDDPALAFATLAKFRAQGPRMCGEYWVGWFDHWGEHHHTTPPADSARGVDWMLGQGISSNLYMAHGGTSFGFMAGANYGRAYEPDTTSYDYDAPIDEAGRPTAKFHALRAVYAKHLPAGEHLPPLPAPLPGIAIPAFALTEHAPLAQLLTTPHHAARPLPVEALGQSYGLVWYRTKISHAIEGDLNPQQLRDYARVYVNGREVAALDRCRKQTTAPVSLAAGDELVILVENMGRINFGPRLQDNLQGITERVLLGGRELTDWEMVPLPLDNLQTLKFSTRAATAPGFHRGVFKLTEGGDTFLDMRAWNKGYVWVNGHNLGRYWRRGPQQSLFVPGCWLRRGSNEVVVFDWSPAPADATLSAVRNPIYGASTSSPSTSSP